MKDKFMNTFKPPKYVTFIVQANQVLKILIKELSPWKRHQANDWRRADGKACVTFFAVLEYKENIRVFFNQKQTKRKRHKQLNKQTSKTK